MSGRDGQSKVDRQPVRRQGATPNLNVQTTITPACGNTYEQRVTKEYRRLLRLVQKKSNQRTRQKNKRARSYSETQSVHMTLIKQKDQEIKYQQIVEANTNHQNTGAIVRNG